MTGHVQTAEGRTAEGQNRAHPVSDRRGGEGIDTARTVDAAPPVRQLLATSALLNSRNAPVQAYFMFASREFKFDPELLTAKIKGHKQIKGSLDEEGRQAVLDKLEQWANSDQDEGYKGKSYDDVIWAAAKAVAHERGAKSLVDLPRLTSAKKIPAHLVKQELDLTPDQKVAKLERLRRQASSDSLELMEFRDTSTQRYVTHKDDPTVNYSIGHTGNFLLGGSLADDYKTLFEQMKVQTGAGDKGLALILLSALRGEDVEGSKKSAVVKFATLVHGPEFRRAAINPIAVQAALQDVAERGGDIFSELRSNVLFFEPDGGSKRSQHHRSKTDYRQDSNFMDVAVNEHDTLVRAAAREGYDVGNSKAMDQFITAMALDNVLAHKVIFKGMKRPPKAKGPAGLSTMQIGTGITIAIAVVALIIVLLNRLISRTAASE